MVTHYIQHNVRRGTRNLFIASILLLAFIAGVVALNKRYLYNVVFGPFRADNTALSALTNVKELDQYYVTVKGDQVVDTGIDEYMSVVSKGEKKNSPAMAHFVMLGVNGHQLFVRVPPEDDMTVSEYSGSLQPLPVSVQEEVVSPVMREVPELTGQVLTFMLNVEDIRGWGFAELAILVPLFLLATWNLIQVIWRTANLELSPAYKALSAYGPIELVVETINREVTDSSAVRIGGACITRHWLLKPTRFGLRAVQLDDLVWIYQVRKVQRARNIDASESFHALFWTQRGKPVEVKGTIEQCTDLVLLVAERAPWALVGHSEENVNAWDEDRKAVIQEVLERKRQMKTQGRLV